MKLLLICFSLPFVTSSSNNGRIKILQLTDAHYSPDYGVGSNAVCIEPQCCKNGTFPTKPENAAGRWGDYRNCDLPWHVLMNAMAQITSNHQDIEYVYYVGDIVDHQVWATSRKKNTEVIRHVSDLIRSSFPSIPVYAVLGNHEAHPLNVFSYNKNDVLSTQWIFQFMEIQWTWLPPDTKGTVLKGGYYTVLVRPGFRIIGLNSNVCYTYNWWLLFDDVDPFDQLKWLVSVLLSAERNNEKVHILSHIPSNDPYCLKNWGKEFAKIVVRFSDTIVAIFNGHTHTVEKIIYYDYTIPKAVAFNGGCLTPHVNVNPNYLIFTINKTTFEVEDYEMWIYHLDKANKQPTKTPDWFRLYSFRDSYNVTSLKPRNMNYLVTEMLSNCSLQDQYFRYKFKQAFPSLSEGCDDNCSQENLCNMVSSYFGEKGLCDMVKEKKMTCK